jgi:SAGA-associated factor 73
MKDMLHAALSGTRGASLFSTGQPSDPSNMPPSRAMLGGLGMGGGGDGFNGSGGGGGQFAPPLSAGLDGPGGQQQGNRRQSVMTGGQDQRQIMPGQLPPPGGQRKASVASGA